MGSGYDDLGTIGPCPNSNDTRTHQDSGSENYSTPTGLNALNWVSRGKPIRGLELEIFHHETHPNLLTEDTQNTAKLFKHY